MQKILITGGGGFLGKAIVQCLNSREDQIFSFSRNFYPELETFGIHQIQGDISEMNTIENACKGMDLVFHVAAKPGVWGKYSEYHKVNTIGTKNVIAACLKHEVPRLIHTSSPSVVFNGTDMEGIDESTPFPAHFHTPYAETKALAEQAVLSAAKKGLSAIILRPHLIWGPGDNHLVPRIISRAKHLVKVGQRDNLVDTTYIDNAADAHILAADRLYENSSLSGNIYFISQGEPIPMWDMINNILQAAGLNPVTRSMPYRVVWLIGALLEFGYKCARMKKEPPMTRFVASELALSHWFDISAARRDLGYTPKVSIKEGLCRLEKWLQNKNFK